jgi:hypothetical protein
LISGLAVGGACVALVAPWLSGLSIGPRLALSLTSVLAAIKAIKRFNRPGFRRIAYGAVGWILVGAIDAEYHVELIAHSRMGAWLVLDFRGADGRRFRAVLGPGNIDADTRRRLILLLSRAEVAQAG